MLFDTPESPQLLASRKMVHDHVHAEVWRKLNNVGNERALDSPLFCDQIAEVATMAAELAYASVVIGPQHLARHLENIQRMDKFEKLCAALVMERGGEVEIPKAILDKVDAGSWMIRAHGEPADEVQVISLVPLAEGVSVQEASAAMEKHEQESLERAKRFVEGEPDVD